MEVLLQHKVSMRYFNLNNQYWRHYRCVCSICEISIPCRTRTCLLLHLMAFGMCWPTKTLAWSSAPLCLAASKLNSPGKSLNFKGAQLALKSAHPHLKIVYTIFMSKWTFSTSDWALFTANCTLLNQNCSLLFYYSRWTESFKETHTKIFLEWKNYPNLFRESRLMWREIDLIFKVFNLVSERWCMLRKVSNLVRKGRLAWIGQFVFENSQLGLKIGYMYGTLNRHQKTSLVWCNIYRAELSIANWTFLIRARITIPRG